MFITVAEHLPSTYKALLQFPVQTQHKNKQQNTSLTQALELISWRSNVTSWVLTTWIVKRGIGGARDMLNWTVLSLKLITQYKKYRQGDPAWNPTTGRQRQEDPWGSMAS